MQPIKIIAEIGSNHNQDINRVYELIDKAFDNGFWGVKFQLFDAETLYADKSNVKELKKSELPIDFIPKIRKYCTEKGIKLGFTPFYLKAVDLLKDYVDFFKISSFDILRLDLIEACLKTKVKHIMISCGLADGEDIKNVRNIYKNNTKHDIKDIYFMHCISKYPVKEDEASLCRINDLFGYIKLNSDNRMYEHIGYSDHTASPLVIKEALSKNCNVIELHFDLDDGLGSEAFHGHCWTPNIIKLLMDYLDQLSKINKNCWVLTDDMKNMRADKITGMRG